MTQALTCNTLVIGGGPGGYVAAIKSGQLGLDTIIVEEGALGGCCLNVGCIPSKALIHAADEFHRILGMPQGSPIGITVASATIDLMKTVAWKDGIVGRLNKGVEGLLKKAKVRVLSGRAHLSDGKTVIVRSGTEKTTVRAENIILATGSRAAALPGLPFGGDVLSSTEALSLAAVPASLAVVGGGYIGMELGTAFAKLGSKVTIIEASSGILPSYDRDLVRPVMQRMKSLGVDVRLDALARRAVPGGLEIEAGGAAERIEAAKILVTVGRRPYTEDMGIAELGLAMNGPAISIDAQCRTSMRGVFAIGDVTGNPMLAHRAMAQGEMVAEIIAGEKRVWDKRAIPEICFTDPEVVQVGEGEAAARAAGVAIKTGVFPFTANGRSMTMEDETGFVKVIAREADHLVIGLQAVGAQVSELSAGFALALEMGARLEDLAGTVHAHPTKSEAVQEAALKALGHALHI